jgi:glycine cleavage system H lipoate-binding protein
MAKTKQEKEDTTNELLRDLLIVQLGLAGVAQNDIREIVEVDIHRVNRICKLLKSRQINQ